MVTWDGSNGLINALPDLSSKGWVGVNEEPALPTTALSFSLKLKSWDIWAFTEIKILKFNNFQAKTHRVSTERFKIKEEYGKYRSSGQWTPCLKSKIFITGLQCLMEDTEGDPIGIDVEVEWILPDKTNEAGDPTGIWWISGSDIFLDNLWGSGPSNVTLPFLYTCFPIVLISCLDNLKIILKKFKFLF